MNQWQSTKDVITWFNESIRPERNIDPNGRGAQSFIQFDIQKFYPSISRNLLEETLEWAKMLVSISQEEIDIIMQSTEHLLYSEGVAWKKIGEDNFDISVGSYSGAEISELVGLKILSELEKLGVNLGLYRDDGFGLLNSSG